MRKGIYLLPNSLTMCGMLFGFYAILASLKGNFVHAAWAIMIATIFDGLDGWVARLTNSTTRFGIELDSLSDVIAFGVAPAVMIYNYSLAAFGRIGWAASFVFVGCGALRLARYNVQMGSTEKKSFTGMPIPGAAAIVASTVLFFNEQKWHAEGNCFVLILIFVLSYFMVSTHRFHGAKEINFRERKPFWILVAIIIALAVFIMQPEPALFVFLMIYLLAGIAENIYLYIKKPHSNTSK